MRETRYAVVLNGGVSLAIWMGGVTHELNRIRLASEGIENAEGNFPMSPAWTAILGACQRTAVIDVLAGTSAGGLNGALLATSVARGADLPDMGVQWTEIASLNVGKLTRGNSTGATSVLDDTYFSTKVADTIAMISPNPAIPKRECTLLVTATALGSQPLPTLLETGVKMYTRDGRRVYKFDRALASTGVGETESNDFDEGNEVAVATLALAARASASFPVAFTPVWESNDLAAKRYNAPSALRGSASAALGRWLVDGGVLDNAPFEPLIDVLRKRPTNKPFDRVLLYVTPGIGAAAGADPSLDPPDLVAAMGGVISAMREPDERLDAYALRHIFRQMSYSMSQAHRTIVDYLGGPADTAPMPFIESAGVIFEGYRVIRSEATERWLSRRSGRPRTLQPPPNPELGPDEIPGIPADDYPAFDGATWEWGWTTADRILRWWGRALSDRDLEQNGAINEEALVTAMEFVGASQRKVTSLWNQLEAAVSGTAACPLTFSEQLCAMRGLYSPEGGGLADAIAEAMLPAAQAIVAAVPGSDVETLMRLSLAIETVSGRYSWLGDQYDAPTFHFHNVTPAAPVPPGLDLSSLAARTDWAKRKLYGERLGHFGAFVSEEGRDHDWLWGRLDGASELSKQMLTLSDVDATTAAALVGDLIAEVLAEKGISTVEVATGATKAYKADATGMLREMANTDHGRAFRELEATIWAITRQYGTAGEWLRALASPGWSPTSELNLGVIDKAKLRIARIWAAPLRWVIRKKLPPPS